MSNNNNKNNKEAKETKAVTAVANPNDEVMKMLMQINSTISNLQKDVAELKKKEQRKIKIEQTCRKILLRIFTMKS